VRPVGQTGSASSISNLAGVQAAPAARIGQDGAFDARIGTVRDQPEKFTDRVVLFDAAGV
jgi:hypothetical protein